MLIDVNIDDSQLTNAIHRLSEVLNNPQKILNGIGNELVYITEDNFSKESGPTGPWHLLAPLTRKSRERVGKWPGKILQVDGSLASSITYSLSKDSVTIEAGSGPSKKYAAIHQFGGMAGKDRKVKIKARPFLPIVGGRSWLI